MLYKLMLPAQVVVTTVASIIIRRASAKRESFFLCFPKKESLLISDRRPG